MQVEKVVDLEQQKLMLLYMNKDLKNKIVALQNHKDILTNALGMGLVQSPRAITKKQIRFKKIYTLAVLAIVVGTFLILATHQISKMVEIDVPIKTKYVIENLRGDTMDTWRFWKLDEEATLIVSIANPDVVDAHKIDVIKGAILSGDKIDIDDSVTHKGLPGTASTYFVGWKGALEEAAKTKTEYLIPSNLKIIESGSGIGNVIITLSTAKDHDGYFGFTKSTVEGNEVLKSQITIYDVDSLSDEGLAAIVRHEFGHAIGLGHSTAPEDLMATTINTQAPYISECDVSAIIRLYEGNAMDKMVCDK